MINLDFLSLIPNTTATNPFFLDLKEDLTETYIF
jgi:hypothetical protein